MSDKIAQIQRIEHELSVVCAERMRQDQLKAEGRFLYTLADYCAPNTLRIGAITEEIGEVSRNLLAHEGLVTDGDGTLAAIHRELSQVAALSIAWMEYLTLLMNEGRLI